MEDQVKSELKSEVASHKPRDEEGHFVHVDTPQPTSVGRPQSPQNPVSQFLSDHTHYSKSQDDLVDVHVGNPLRKITQLLEDIKKQKAFSFTLKGSLGIMGVFLTLSIFGVLGGGQMLCNKGTQTEIGTIKVLQVQDQDAAAIPALSFILDYFSPRKSHNRNVLVKDDQTVLRIPYSRFVDVGKFMDYSVYPEPSRRVIATGNYDSCSQTLTITDPTAIEYYFKK